MEKDIDMTNGNTVNGEDLKPENTAEETNRAESDVEDTLGNNNAEEADKTEENECKTEETADKDPLEAANEEIAALKDKYLRSVAEFENYRMLSGTVKL